MKLIYSTSIKYPSNLANRIQISKMSKYFSKNLGKDNFYLGGSKIKNFPEDINLINFSFFKKSFLLAISYIYFIYKKNITHVYSREDKLLFFIIIYSKFFFWRRYRFYYEAHFVPERISFIYRFVLRKCSKIIVLTSFIKKEFIDAGLSDRKILIAPDGVSLEDFEIEKDKESLRKDLCLPVDKKIIMYTGRLYDWKGAGLLAECAKQMKNDFVFVFIGGTKSEIYSFKKSYSSVENIQIIGFKDNREIPKYLKCADLLVLPNSAKNIISYKYTSPMKLFEYMASGIPIVASDIPSIREVLNRNNCLFFEADNVDDLANKIQFLIENNSLYDSISKNALKDILRYEWDDRARSVINFIK